MPTPVISVAQMREWEKATWASGQTEATVMRMAGEGVARVIERTTRPGDRIVVLAGKGHNGDDAALAAEALAERNIEVVRVIDPEQTLSELDRIFSPTPALVVDGLFGIGLSRPLGASWLKLIQRINQSSCPILALDVPSGLNGDTGLPLDDAIRATTTVTVGAIKQGLLNAHAWPFVGRLEVAPEIGLIPYPFTTELTAITAADFADFPPRRPQAGHKGSFGHLGILAGSMGYHGAGVLASKGAQRAQPGLITLCTDPRVYTAAASHLEAVMVRDWSPSPAFPENCTALLAGPGLAAATGIPDQVRDFVRTSWLKSPLAVMVDASGLAWIPSGAVQSEAVRVITPHPGEAARLLGKSSAEVQTDRPGAVRELSRKFGDCLVVLKGHQTIVGSTKDGLRVNLSGNPWLGQGGTGDILGGFIAGLLAQPALQKNPLETVCFAVWQHGAVADALSASRGGWVPEELVELLGKLRA